jgi:hypothetical protein
VLSHASGGPERTPRLERALRSSFGILGTVVDSGAQFFCSGEIYFRQLNELTLTVSVAKNLTDEEWMGYLEGSLAIAKGLGLAAKVGLVCFVNAFPTARQRQVAADLMVQHYIPELSRLAVITESVAIRGAMTAFGWLMPKVRAQAFANNDSREAISWLREAGGFDEPKALAAWQEAKMKLSIRSTSLFPAAPRSR